LGYFFGVRSNTITVRLKPPLTRAKLRAVAGGNLNRWANEVFAQALAERPPGPARWTRWLRAPGRAISQEEINRWCEAE
jgi:hypothetical protein